MWIYLRYFLISFLVLAAAIATALGGIFMWLGFLLISFLVVGGDEMFGEDTDNPDFKHPWILNLQLYSSLPLLIVLSFAFAWQLSDRDLLGFGAWVQQFTGYDLIAVRAQNEWWHYLGAGLGLGMFYGGVGTVVAHELTHRTWSKPAMFTGRWMLASTCDASFAIEHVYGHHKNVATRQDPATARRGENAWFFVVRSTVQSYLHAWKLEKDRLAKFGFSTWNWRNRMHRGNLMTLCYAAFFYWAAGWTGVAAFFAISIYGKGYLEFINYVEHYGLVRVPGTPIEPRHSWNCNKRVSTYLLYNLTRHSHHHAQGELPFWKLQSYPDAPMLPSGYLGMILLSTIPPLWNIVMIPKVKEWDRLYATEAERPYIEEANRLSKRKEFTDDYDFETVSLKPSAA